MFSKFKAAPLPLWAIAGLQLLLVSVPIAAQVQAQAQAQADRSASPTPVGTRSDPADSNAQVPATLYASPLHAYRGFAEPQVAPWRETNEVVRQRGGWRAYAREAQQADAPVAPDAADAAAPGASRPAPAARPASSGHAGHETK